MSESEYSYVDSTSEFYSVIDVDDSANSHTYVNPSLILVNMGFKRPQKVFNVKHRKPKVDVVYPKA